jgi:uncharacterized protein (DUF2236 family)
MTATSGFSPARLLMGVVADVRNSNISCEHLATALAAKRSAAYLPLASFSVRGGKIMTAPTEHDPPEIVIAESLERELSLVRGAAAGSLSGLFGPRSITWQVNRESAIFLGAGRALLLQLAHPWVAAAVEQHSDTFANPIGRFHRTFSTVFTMVFGTLDQSLAAARHLHRRHAAIEGKFNSAAGPFPVGSPYCANEVSALRWVHATLWETAPMAYALVLPPLARDQRERYYAEGRLFAALFGIPTQYLPPDWAAFSAYIDAMTRSSTLTVTEVARVMAHRLLSGADTWLPVPPGYKALTAALLPPRLRDGFALRYGKAERDAAQQFIARARRIYPFLPSRLRYVGPYQEAEQRLAGKTQPDFVARMCNRFWMGQPELGHWPV